ncbi:Major facilitator superfamily protein [Perilla frutescens var. hirtella]|nr:Major facilitator superfamily protein [Perilla frutescens var. frutescens]KAH6801017.1 Major facilitator superfamily protein [Perilla frutescens var. hirtella]
MPVLVLAARICPPGMEATLFATLMSISNEYIKIRPFLGLPPPHSGLRAMFSPSFSELHERPHDMVIGFDSWLFLRLEYVQCASSVTCCIRLYHTTLF